MAGKPSFLNYLPPLSKETAMLEHAGYRDRVRGVQATDEMIVRHSHRKQLLALPSDLDLRVGCWLCWQDHLVQTLTELEMLDSTYMFYTVSHHPI